LDHLNNQKNKWNDEIENLKAQMEEMRRQGKHDWPVVLSRLDPIPDAQQAAQTAELINDMKPFLRDAKSIKQSDIDEGRENSLKIDQVREVVRTKLDAARGKPLLPEEYRFLGR